MPPLFRAASATAKASISAGSRTSVRLPRGIGPRGPDDAEVDPQRLVAEISSAIDLDALDDVPRRAPVAFAAAVERIGEGAEADMGDETGPAGADLAKERHDDAGGQRVGLDLLLERESLHRRRPAPVTADDAGDQAFMRQPADAGALAVADAERVDDGEIARMAGREEARLDGAEHGVGFEQPAARAGDGDRRAVADLGRRRGGGDLPHTGGGRTLACLLPGSCAA